MTNKSYDSPQYVAQKLRDSLEKLLEKKSGSKIFEVKNWEKPETNESFVSYKIMGVKTEITITKKGRRSLYAMSEEISKGPSTKEFHSEELHPKRSNTKRISEQYMDKIARQSFTRFKKYHQSKQ